jgi:hypothetical protein
MSLVCCRLTALSIQTKVSTERAVIGRETVVSVR